MHAHLSRLVRSPALYASLALLAAASLVARPAARAALVTAGLGATVLTFGGRRAGAPPAPRLRVAARTGLGPRTSAVVLEVDRAAWLVVHGEGFAELRPLEPPRPVPGSAANGGDR